MHKERVPSLVCSVVRSLGAYHTTRRPWVAKRTAVVTERNGQGLKDGPHLDHIESVKGVLDDQIRSVELGDVLRVHTAKP